MFTITPINYNNNINSFFKSILLILLFIGIIFLSIGYSKQQYSNIPKIVEYKYIPENFNYNNIPIMDIYGGMFQDRDPLSKKSGYTDTFPWQRQNINSKIVLPFNNPNSGFGKKLQNNHTNIKNN